MKYGWKDHDWDFSYLLDLEYKKLVWMRDYFQKSEISPTNIERAHELDIVIKLMDIVRERDSADELNDYSAPIGRGSFRQTKYVNTKNAQRFIKSTDVLDQINDNTSIGVIFRNMLRVEKAWYLLNRAREMWLRNWWD